MKKVLVSGGCGFLGSHLVDRLLLRDDVELILVVDNLWTGRTKNLAHINDPRLDLVECSVEKYSTKVRFDEIIHLASPASPPWYMREPVRVIQANVQGALNLLDHLAPQGRICYTSTSEVYGNPLVSPQPESYRGSVDCTGPRSSYDESKRCTEALLFESQRVSGLDIRVARLFNAYGPRTRIDDGRAISNFLGQALTTGQLTVYGNGLQSRSWGYVDDIVEGLARFFWRDDIRYRGPLNVGNDREIPVIDIARHVQKLVSGTTIKFMPPVPQDPINRRPDLTLAKAVLPGWNAEIPYEEGVCRTLEWFRAELANGLEPLQAPEPLFETKAGLGTRRLPRASAVRDRREAANQSGRQVHSA
jgi:UDP-glucose 4-epimerase/UDP-glucuronate decarboxylase